MDPAALDAPALRSAAAACWARLLERPVAVAPALEDAPASLPFAAAGLLGADGARCRLDVDTHLLAGRLDVLGGGRGRPVGPTPLSPAEEGLFAWLVLHWIALLPEPRPALAWIHGGAPVWPLPAAGERIMSWRVEIDGAIGLARWYAPAPAPAEIVVGSAALDAAPRPGDRIPLAGAPMLIAGARAWPLARRGATWTCAAGAAPWIEAPGLEATPLVAQAVLGSAPLTPAELSALRPGDVLPLQMDDPPVIALRRGERTLAIGILVAEGGRPTMQVTRAG